MTRVNLSTLLDECQILSSSEFLKRPQGKKVDFLTRVEASVNSRRSMILNELSHTGGLKMHFHVCKHPRLGWQNLPNQTFAKKVAFFASKTIISFPFLEINPTNGDDLAALLDLLCSIRVYLREGLVDLIASDNDLRQAASRRLNEKYGLVAANFELEQLEHQFEEPVYEAQVLNLYLPFFHNIEQKEIISLRRKEKLLYDGLEHHLEKLLLGRSRLMSESVLLKELYEIDRHVRNLEEKYKGIQDALRRQDIYALIGFATVGLVVLIPTGIGASLVPLLGTGSMSVLKYLEWKMTASQKARGQRDDEYYLLWKLYHRESLFSFA